MPIKHYLSFKSRFNFVREIKKNYPSLEQKQFGNRHFEESHLRARSPSSTITGGGAV